MPSLPTKAGARPWIPKARPQGRTPYQAHAVKSPLYNTRQWQRARLAHLRSEPCCRRCASMGQTVPATVVDHIIQVNAGADFWDSTNWQSLCQSCHARKSAKEGHANRKKNESPD